MRDQDNEYESDAAAGAVEQIIFILLTFRMFIVFFSWFFRVEFYRKLLRHIQRIGYRGAVSEVFRMTFSNVTLTAGKGKWEREDETVVLSHPADGERYPRPLKFVYDSQADYWD